MRRQVLKVSKELMSHKDVTNISHSLYDPNVVKIAKEDYEEELSEELKILVSP